MESVTSLLTIIVALMIIFLICWRDEIKKKEEQDDKLYKRLDLSLDEIQNILRRIEQGTYQNNPN